MQIEWPAMRNPYLLPLSVRSCSSHHQRTSLLGASLVYLQREHIRTVCLQTDTRWQLARRVVVSGKAVSARLEYLLIKAFTWGVWHGCCDTETVHILSLLIADSLDSPTICDLNDNSGSCSGQSSLSEVRSIWDENPFGRHFNNRQFAPNGPLTLRCDARGNYGELAVPLGHKTTNPNAISSTSPWKCDHCAVPLMKPLQVEASTLPHHILTSPFLTFLEVAF